MAYQGHERRRSQADRRQSTRSGKFDRRKNRCNGCQFYKPQSDIAGLCQKHQAMIRAEDFACVWFTALGQSGLPASEPPETEDAQT